MLNVKLLDKLAKLFNWSVYRVGKQILCVILENFTENCYQYLHSFIKSDSGCRGGVVKFFHSNIKSVLDDCTFSFAKCFFKWLQNAYVLCLRCIINTYIGSLLFFNRKCIWFVRSPSYFVWGNIGKYIIFYIEIKALLISCVSF